MSTVNTTPWEEVPLPTDGVNQDELFYSFWCQKNKG